MQVSTNIQALIGLYLIITEYPQNSKQLSILKASTIYNSKSSFPITTDNIQNYHLLVPMLQSTYIHNITLVMQRNHIIIKIV